MVAGNWFNNDGLFVQYGTAKAVPTTAGDYLSLGAWREVELTINLASLTASPVIQANTTIFPTTQVFVESVQVDTEVGATGGTSFSVGLMGMDRATPLSNTAFLSAAPIANHTTAGQLTNYTAGVTGAGTYVGTTINTAGGAYISALAAGTYTLGTVKVRIRYRGIGTITQ